ncbi:NeuD/PglB/VioB family sugar acetyltransferase [Cumulibacter manganitolerans]|uniref:NeuD/PglB/VioB family sugar acetyltransferase n=1 Tax=Cumulibacter manganitolerans TaxID=1884992 RepID=UPI0012960BC5|nr:NeuD/PglB/VioB family sugar acetyltransferase [Cumulibacter manganitolerans]
MAGGVLLVGASGLTREVIASGIEDVVGVLDDDPALAGTCLAGVPVIGPVELAARRDERLLIGIGPSGVRRTVVERLTSLGVRDDRYATYLAPSVRVGTGSTVGAGSIVLDGCVLTADVRVGRHVVLMPSCTLTHDDELDDFVTLAAGVRLGGGVRVQSAAYVGMNASARQGVTIGAGAIVGMGAVVLGDVPYAQTWVGVPAVELKE